MSPTESSKNIVTLRDVAVHANVSVMTVSNVVNGKHELMKPETRERVQNSIELLGYRTRASGRGLRIKRNMAIGVLIVDKYKNFLVDPYIGQVVAGLSTLLAQNKYSCILQGIEPKNLENSILFSDARTDGIVTLCAGTRRSRAKILETLLRAREPIVLLQDSVNVLDADIAAVRQNDFDGAYRLTRILTRQGSRKFLYIRPEQDWAAIEERFGGASKALQREKAVAIDQIRCGSGSFDDTLSALSTYFGAQHHPDAIIAHNDQIAVASISFLKSIGLRVPGDVRVTGFNGLDICRYVEPTLTTVVSPAYALGKKAAKIMIERLSAGTFVKKETVLPVKLRIGMST